MKGWWDWFVGNHQQETKHWFISTPKFGSLLSLISIQTFPTIYLPKTRSVLVTCGLFLALDVATSLRIADLIGDRNQMREQKQ